MPAPAQPEHHAFSRGRAEGFAIGALAIGVLSFIQLLGAEKALLAIVLGVLALREAPAVRSRTHSRIAIGLGVLYVLITAATLILFRDQLAELVRLLQTLG